MTKKHIIYFILFRIFLFIKGIRKRKLVYTYSEDKRKVFGCITNINGTSSTDKIYGFTIYIDWFEPIYGNDNKYYRYGSYYYKQFKNKEVNLI